MTRKIPAAILAIVLSFVAITPSPALASCRTSLWGTNAITLIQPSGNPGSTWFEGVEADIEIRRPGFTTGFTWYGINMVYDYNVYYGQFGSAYLRFQFNGSDNLTLHAFASDAYATEQYNETWSVNNLDSLDFHNLRITIRDNGRFDFYLDDGLMGSSPLFPLTWRGNEVYAQAGANNRSTLIPGGAANMANYDNLRYTTQYGSDLFSSTSTTIWNTQPTWYAGSEPAGGQFDYRDLCSS